MEFLITIPTHYQQASDENRENHQLSATVLMHNQIFKTFAQTLKLTVR